MRTIRLCPRRCRRPRWIGAGGGLWWAAAFGGVLRRTCRNARATRFPAWHFTALSSTLRPSSTIPSPVQGGMAYTRIPVQVAQSYAEAHGPESPHPEDLQAFYDDMERRETLEHKMSKRKSNSSTSIWSRKSLKRSPTAPSIHPPVELHTNSSTGDLQAGGYHGDGGWVERGGEQHNSGPQLTTSRSVIVDTGESPPWTGNDAWSAVPAPAFKVSYKLHNPLGPRWYKNHHLIPPSQIKPSMRPPTFFSPSFPPIGTSSSPERHDDDAGPSGTPSHSPSHTPASSQTRVMDGGKPRSRKTSQTTPDNVDLLDVSDPWGSTWHHQSPYDCFQTPAASADREVPRPRRASMTAAQNRHQSVIPSPLSQSSSAVHLPVSQREIHIPRKLSKRRTPAVESIFPSQPPEVDRKATSAPPTPLERPTPTSSPDTDSSQSNVLPKRMSVAPPQTQYMMSQPVTSKKEKRGSMLNRLVKKFSILKRSSDNEASSSAIDSWHYSPGQDPSAYTNVLDSGLDRGRVSPEKPHRDSVKRVPPPPVDQVLEPQPVESAPRADRTSVASIEVPYSMGRLTVANPDLPDDGKVDLEEAPPPPEKSIELTEPVPPEGDNERPPPKEQPLPAPPVQSHPPGVQPVLPPPLSVTEARLRVDKPLPPPQLATPEFSQLALSDFHLETPWNVDKSLPPPTPNPKSPLPDRTLTHSPVDEKRPSLERRDSSQPQAGPSKPRGSTPSNHTSDVPSRILSPIQTSTVLENSKRSASQKKSTPSPSKEVSSSSSDDPVRTRSPPVQARGHNEILKGTSSQQKHKRQDSSSSNAATVGVSSAPERTPTVRAPAPTHTRERTPEASTSTSRQHTVKDRSHTRSESALTPAPVQVPFPSNQYAVPFPAQGANGVQYLGPSYEDSPLSTSSMIVNPPTPYDHRLSLNGSVDQTPPTLPPKSLYEEKREQEVSPTTTTPTRQTEMFKLVRSSSGNVYASGQTISAAGQQWEVVESIDVKKDKSSRSRDQERRSKERERGQDRERRERENERERERRREREREEERARRREREKQEERERKRELEKEEERERRRQREREEERERRRAREREEERERRQAREKEKEREREKERVREREKEREKERARERRREREHRSIDYDRPSRDHDLDYEHRSRGYEPQPRDPSYRSTKDTEHQAKEYDHRAKDYDSSRRRDSKFKVDPEHVEHSSYRSSKQIVYVHEESPKRSSGQTTTRHNGDRSRTHDDYKSSRQREEHLERRSPDIPSSSRPQPIPIQMSVATPAPVPVILVPTPPEPPAPLRRNPSITVRPTSELPSAAEMEAIRAKESWDMERLWKARSMYGTELNAPRTNFIRGPGSSSSLSDDAPTHSAIYGSSHTAYVVQPPFQTRGSQIYHSLPTAPPPIIYSSPASIPSIPDSISTYDYEPVYRTYPAPSPSDYRITASMPRPLNNPLPEPPRESPYEPAPLSSMRPSKKHSNDYWKHPSATH
ncbi:unnamed protein product [Cyclocybe aegerita]|uniref:Uncharacterized protein n=1 Tax=Cyclocybe aegerita TaxID=1973307 RepID=A0A8S0VXA8_CYCAE|nr:unnamed protein product [Cyclocybe aegerita]